MRNIFFQFYMGMLVAIVTIALIAFGALSLKNKFRMEAYLSDVMSGTYVLLAKTVSRKTESERVQWLQNIKDKSGLSVDLLSVDNASLSSRKKQKLHENSWLVTTEPAKSYATIYIKIPGDENSILFTRTENSDESIVQAMGLLVQEEITLDKSEPLKSKVDYLSELFSFPVRLSTIKEEGLNLMQQGVMEKNRLLVRTDKVSRSDFVMTVFLPLPTNNGKLLVLGPIPKFNPLPGELVLIAGMFSLFLMALSAYVLVSPLERRLKRMTAEVESVGVESGTASITVEGNDVLGALAQKVNAMASRIHNLLESQKELTRGVSHELKTPIARLKFHLEFLDGALADMDKPEVYKKHLSGVKNNVLQLEHLVDEMLTYASLEQTKPVLNFIKINISDMLTQQVSELQAVKPHINITFKCSESLPMAVADEHFLKRACQNLMTNAQHHTKSLVEVSYELRGKNHCIYVDDDGDGVPDAMWETILEPFRRLDPSRNRQSGGYGLGLSIVYQIMRWHQGNIEITDSPYGGARFCLKWPTDLAKRI